MTDTQICNMALAHLGTVNAISVLETDRSAEAEVCRVFYENTRDEMVRGFLWPFATEIVTLALVEEDPNTEWGYSYRYPADCLFFRRIQSGSRNDSRQSRVRYRVARDSSGRLIFTDQEDASAEYTVRITDNSLSSPDFVTALSYRLAVYIAPRLTAGDPFKLQARALELYQLSNAMAQARAAGEEELDEEVESEFIRAREED